MTATTTTQLTQGQSNAVLVLVGIKLDILSDISKADATQMLESNTLNPHCSLNLNNQAVLARNTVIANGLAEKAQAEANVIMKQYKII